MHPHVDRICPSREAVFISPVRVEGREKEQRCLGTMSAVRLHCGGRVYTIEDTPNIVLRTRTVVEALEGTQGLERLRWRHLETGETGTHAAHHLFLMTGALPNSEWVKGCVVLDEKDFIKAGADLRSDELSEAGWPLSRSPFLSETSMPGVFVVGDVRSGSVKRVASAVGEGSVCVQLIHRVLAES